MQADRLNSRLCCAFRDRPEPFATDIRRLRPRPCASTNGSPAPIAHRRRPVPAAEPRPEAAVDNRPREAADRPRGRRVITGRRWRIVVAGRRRVIVRAVCYGAPDNGSGGNAADDSRAYCATYTPGVCRAGRRSDRHQSDARRAGQRDQRLMHVLSSRLGGYHSQAAHQCDEREPQIFAAHIIEQQFLGRS